MSEEMIIVKKQIDAVDCTDRTVEWCRLPYPGHPKGCPNYGRRRDCPPFAPHFLKKFSPPFYLVAVRFNLAAHAEKMKKKHPHWTEKQARCLLYWQPRVNKILRQACIELIKQLPPGFNFTLKPEAMRVNVITTAFKAGIPIKTRPGKYVWKIALIGKERSGR